MKITDIIGISSKKHIDVTFEILTDNNFHNDTSILNAYIALGVIPQDAPEYERIWSILEGLKEIDRKSYTQGFLRFEDLENRAALDKELIGIVNTVYSRGDI